MVRSSQALWRNPPRNPPTPRLRTLSSTLRGLSYLPAPQIFWAGIICVFLQEWVLSPFYATFISFVYSHSPWRLHLSSARSFAVLSRVRLRVTFGLVVTGVSCTMASVRLPDKRTIHCMWWPGSLGCLRSLPTSIVTEKGSPAFTELGASITGRGFFSRSVRFFASIGLFMLEKRSSIT